LLYFDDASLLHVGHCWTMIIMWTPFFPGQIIIFQQLNNNSGTSETTPALLKQLWHFWHFLCAYYNISTTETTLALLCVLYFNNYISTTETTLALLQQLRHFCNVCQVP
jgi:hypothetical protein